MMKYWKLILFLLVVALLAIAVHLRMVSNWPYPVRTFEEIPIDGWYAPVYACHANEKGEMVYVAYVSKYCCTSNAVTGVVTIERWQK
jgi:hypothetical protein